MMDANCESLKKGKKVLSRRVDTVIILRRGSKEQEEIMRALTQWALVIEFQLSAAR